MLHQDAANDGNERKPSNKGGGTIKKGLPKVQSRPEKSGTKVPKKPGKRKFRLKKEVVLLMTTAEKSRGEGISSKLR